MMFTLLGLGFIIGMRHAFEADHAAAVATLVTKRQSIGHSVKQGIVWGVGHTFTLLLFSSLVFLSGSIIPERLAHGLELLVGCMLVGLGIDVLRKIVKERIHFHIHQHHDRAPHFHAHSHQGESLHNSSAHEHAHPQGFPYRALCVGLMHGMAGSAALIILTLHTTVSPVIGFLYIVVFGLGSLAGMAALSLVIALPLRYATPSLTWLHSGVQGCIGTMTVPLGTIVIYSTGASLMH